MTKHHLILAGGAAAFFVLGLWRLTAPVIRAAEEGGISAPLQAPAIEAPLLTAGGDRPANEFYKAKVLQIVQEGARGEGAEKQLFQIVKVLIKSGALKGQEIIIEHGGLFSIVKNQKVKKGDSVVVVKIEGPERAEYFIADDYRLPSLWLIIALFFSLAVFWGRAKGLASILGLAFTILILVKFITPQILSGKNPLLISLVGAFFIAVISLYLAHGFTRRTSIALLSTLLTLAISALLAVFFVSLTRLTGVGTEEAFYLQIGPLETLNLKGLLLGGIIIGVLGILDDITTSQVAAIDEISKANRRLGFSELYQRGLSVGYEHIASLVNTLVLAYAGASLPLFLLFIINTNQPAWVIFNSEFVAEEIIRTLVGSTALILAVPIATFLAAYFFSAPLNEFDS